MTLLSKTNKRVNGCVVWKCRCDCGKIGYHVGYRVRNGTIKSCGCSRTIKDKQKAGIRNMYRDYKRNARSRMLKFSLPFSIFKKLVNSNCFYCKEKPEHRRRKYDYIANGVDRKDPNKGYVLTNVVSCCSICNRAKGSMSFSDFMNYLRRFK